ncbi:MAG: hypothetical protein ACTS2F_16235 [Thainema sp.]
MDTFFLETSITAYEKAMNELVNSPEYLITGGMVADVLDARSVVQDALSYEHSNSRQHLLDTPSESLLQKLEQLDCCLKKQVSRILASVDLASMRESLNTSEFRDQIINGWWWYLDREGFNQ